MLHAVRVPLYCVGAARDLGEDVQEPQRALWALTDPEVYALAAKGTGIVSLPLPAYAQIPCY